MLHYPNPQSAINMPRHERHPWLPHEQPSPSPMAPESLGYHKERRPERSAADEGGAVATHLNNLPILHTPPGQWRPSPPKRKCSHPPGAHAGLSHHQEGRRERHPHDEDGEAATDRKGPTILHMPPSNGPPFLQHRSEEGSRATTNQSVSAMTPSGEWQPQLLHLYHSQTPREHYGLYEERRLEKNLTNEGGRATINQSDPTTMLLGDWRTPPAHQYYPQMPIDHDGFGRYGEQRLEQNSFYEGGKPGATWKRQAIVPLEEGRPSPPHHGPGHDEQERPEQNLNDEGSKVAESWTDQVSMPPDTGNFSPPHQFYPNLPRRHDRPGQQEAGRVDKDPIYEDGIAVAEKHASQINSSHDSRKAPRLAPPNKDMAGRWEPAPDI